MIRLDQVAHLIRFITILLIPVVLLLPHITIKLPLSLPSFSAPKRRTEYLWITPRSDGFNNQLISVYQGLLCARLLSRTAVLPHLYENVRWDTKRRGPFPFEDYFHLSPFSAPDFNPPVTTVSLLWSSLRRKHETKISTTVPPVSKLRTLPPSRFSFKDVCDDGQLYHADKSRSRHGKPLLHFYRQSLFTGLRMAKVNRSSILTLVQLQKGNRAANMQCIDDSLCPRYEGQLGPYSNYRVNGQGFDIRRSLVFREIRSRLHATAAIKRLATKWIDEEIGQKDFNAMHVRLGDFRKKCKREVKLCRKYGKGAILQSRKTLLKTLKRFSNQSLPVFVSTTDVRMCKKMFNKKRLEMPMMYMQDFRLGKDFQKMRRRTDQLALASQVMASYAKEFVGNRFSSFTSEINNMRYVKNGEEELMFFDDKK